MVNAFIIESQKTEKQFLESLILKTCPEINISGKIDSLVDIKQHLRDSKSTLMFVDVDDLRKEDIEIVDTLISDFEVIFVTTTEAPVLKAIQYASSWYIEKPVKKNELIITVNNAIRNIERKEEQARFNYLLEKLTRQNSQDRIIGIPTLEGFEFLLIDEIIRLEGLQKCTRIITTQRTDMISSYNLGEFCRILDRHGFFSPHKSHLINLKFIRQYSREGNIVMQNGSHVPVSKRRKKDFLNQFLHL
jgi:two-component system LytT family response regulator